MDNFFRLRRAGHQRCFKEASRVFQESFNGVSRKIEGCLKRSFQWSSEKFQESSNVFKEDFKGAQRKISGCFKEVSRMLQEHYKGVSKKIEGCFKAVSKTF